MYQKLRTDRQKDIKLDARTERQKAIQELGSKTERELESWTQELRERAKKLDSRTRRKLYARTEIKAESD